MDWPTSLADIETPAAVVDVDRMVTNLRRMADYAAAHGIALRPHTKTHKTPALAAEQIRLGAVGVTVAQLREAELMADVADDIYLAYPPVGRAKLERLLSLSEQARVRVALDSLAALRSLSAAAAESGREIGVLVEIDVGMHRVGVPEPEETVRLAAAASELPGVAYRGITFYPGHIREPISEQAPAIAQLNRSLARHISALEHAGLAPAVVSGGSTPAAFASHQIDALTEIRPGTYIFNDRTTAAVGACTWDDCAYTVLATVVSTAIPGQAVIDAGSKALSREEIRAENASGFGALLDKPDVVVRALSEEHGILDVSRSSWTPRVGERVRVVPNHVCVSVNLHERLWGVRHDVVEQSWVIAARGWSRAHATV